MQRSRTQSWLVILFAAILGCTTGCQRKSDVPEETQEVSFRHYFSFTGPFAGTMHAIASDFNRSNLNTKLRVTPQDHEAFKTSIHADLQSGQPADIYSYWAGARVQSIVDHLAPLDDTLPPTEMNRIFGNSVVQSACTYNGHIYLLPVTQHLVGFFYNKKIFAEQGLNPPKTWTEFLDLGNKLKAKGITPIAMGSKAKWPAQFWFDYLLLRTTPPGYRQKLMEGKAAYTDPEVVHAFSLWRDLIKTGMFNPRPNELEFDTGAGMMVRNGKAAMTLMGTWITGYFSAIKVNWQEDSDYGFFPFPTIDPQIPTVALGPIDGLVIPKNAKNVASAKTVLKYFAGNNTQETLSKGMGALPASQLVSKDGLTPMKKAILGEISTAKAWAFNYDLATPPARAEIGLQLFTDFLESPDQFQQLLKETDGKMKQLALPAGK